MCLVSHNTKVFLNIAFIVFSINRCTFSVAKILIKKAILFDKSLKENTITFHLNQIWIEKLVILNSTAIRHELSGTSISSNLAKIICR